MINKELIIKELDRLKDVLDPYVYETCLHWINYGPNQYKSALDLIYDVEIYLEPCPF